MTAHTPPRALRFTALAAVPLLALAVGCGGDDGGVQASKEVASAPAAGPTADPTADGPATAGRKDTTAFFDAQMKYVRCMRTKGGIEDFPDPRLSGYLDWAKIDALTDPNGSGEEQKGGKGGVCNHEMSEAMKREPKRDAQKDYESMLAHAQCMRENGASKFGNPTMSGGNVVPGGETNPVNPTMDRRSPAYKKAREACEGKLLEGLDGMQ
ncbi:hypothetical protein AB0I16_26950 [Streptomyces sp. NPDC050703]|uniref:hypothetical protein n=1 Tax=Streptomyces sp. NPDC050703 TaxID=3157218 RepID=UPI0034414005